MTTVNENFQTLINQFATEKGFVANSNSQLWAVALARFNSYSEVYKNIMPYSFFVENVLKGF